MKSIYHVNLGPGSLIYEEFQYPAGEFQIRLRPMTYASVACATELRVTARLSDGNDLMRLALLADSLRGVNYDAPRTLILPYLPYGRADRRFVAGDCFGVATFGGMINTLGFDRVATLDAHSQVGKFFIQGLLDVPALPLITKAIYRFALRRQVREVTVLFPDEGARKRYKLPEVVGCNADVIAIRVRHCTKHRDPVDGTLSGFDVPAPKDLSSAVLIVDDICDGGGTFLGIAEALQGYDALGLYVTHGIFSKGFDRLLEKFDRIYTTNSFDNRVTHEQAHRFECEPVIGAALRKVMST